MDEQKLQGYRWVQGIARITMDYLRGVIQEGKTEAEIANAANEFMQRNKASFWYHGVGSLVLVGKRTELSMSGKEYVPSDERVAREDLVTVDLSPEIDGYWGDFARSFVVGKGYLVNDAKPDSSELVKELLAGIKAEEELHRRLKEIATLDMTFGQLYEIMNYIRIGLGFVNLDTRGNFGHSIEKILDARAFIEDGETTMLGDKLFTFEPHIKKPDSPYGYKREDIYYFLDGVLQRL